MHFERMAREYAGSRPPYPDALFAALRAAGVAGPGLRVLEVGAGDGLATRELLRLGSGVVALEPGQQLADLLAAANPGAEVVHARLEDAILPDTTFDSVVAATSLHWVDLSVGLPKLHAALRPHGWLAVWRTIFGDDSVETKFRRRVTEIVAARQQQDQEPKREERPTMEELAAGGWFDPVGTQHWRWSIYLSTDQVRRLFRTFQ
ncbi:class I SAM-dependent methyltransferase [Pedococcus sp. 5OH_020]|uniref:class I SAM-dependent methyltransferase n=1 Tax=Pedococcus sp. 5OH_020 TaxID=2989814 RepID=UPI0022E9CC62|nr:class I SAM-dependent methyltransferase [Pedococcus sp. 5OH_020]